MFFDKLNTLIVVIILGSLTGCTGMSGSFSCNETAHDNCTPVSVVNQQVDNGTYDARAEEHAASFKSKLSGYDAYSDGYIGKNPIREVEKTKRIWIAPYVDMQDNFHEANTIYTVLTKPYWIGEQNNR